MATVMGRVTVEAPIEVVWDVYSDVERYAELSSAFTERVTYVSDGPVGEGTVYREYGGVGPMRDESEWVVTTFEAPRRQVHEGDLGALKPVLTAEFTPVGEGTRVEQTVEYELFPRARRVGRVLERAVVNRAIASGMRDTLNNLKRMAEAEHARREVDAERAADADVGMAAKGDEEGGMMAEGEDEGMAHGAGEDEGMAVGTEESEGMAGETGAEPGPER